MIKGKGAGTLIIIIVVCVCVWVAFVSFILRPSFLVGSALSLGGGSVIGAVVAYLMRRWWFKGIRNGRRLND